MRRAGRLSNIVLAAACVGMISSAPTGGHRALAEDGPPEEATQSSDALTRSERAALVAKAEAEARERFAEDHYVFVTAQGRVDPAEGGIPAFAVNDRHWTLYRGGRRVSEVDLLRLLGRVDDAKALRRRQIGLYCLGGVATLVTAIGAGTSNVLEDPDRRDVIGGVAVVGGFTTVIITQFRLGRRAFSLGQLFLDVQMLNDQIREGIRAQVRLEYGVPLEVPSIRSP